jgi:perosamine synthetase
MEDSRNAKGRWAMSKEDRERSISGVDGVNTAGVFIQTSSVLRELDNWKQMTEQEAEMAYEMTLRNELSGGTPVVREFEKTWRERFGVRFAISVINGTAAIYSALFGLGVGPGDEVICPSYTWICSISPAVTLMARPVFCEIDPETLLIDPEDARSRITDRTRAIVAVHLWGNPCNMDELMRLSRETGIPIVEDCSHCHGALYRGKPVGSIGHAGAWSLQGTKPVSAGEGGVFGTNEIDVFERACLIGQVNRVAGLDLVTDRYKYLQPLGFGGKFRAHPLGIGIASVQLERLDRLNERRRSYMLAVRAGIQDLPGLKNIKSYEGTEPGGFYGFPVRYVPAELGGYPKEKFLEALQKQGLSDLESAYSPLHSLPLFARGFDLFTRGRGPLCTPEMGGDYKGYKKGDLPVTEEVCSNLIFLPVLSDPVEGAAGRIVEALQRAVETAKAGQ